MHAIVQTVADLDAARAAIIEASNGVARSTWRLGRLLLDVQNHGLWQLRKNADGKCVYKSFGEFCRRECDLRHAMVSIAMKVADEFSEDDAARFGVTKLARLLAAPEEDRPALRQKLEQGATRKELEADVVRLNAEKRPRARHDGDVRRPAERKQPTPAPQPAPVVAPEPPAPQPAPLRDDVVTIALRKRQVVLMFRGSKEKLTRAKSLGDRPWARIDGLNEGVVFWATLKEDEGGLYLVVEAEREEPTP